MILSRSCAVGWADSWCSKAFLAFGTSVLILRQPNVTSVGTKKKCSGVLKPQLAPARWQQPCSHTECSLHQLSPYIGKIKSGIAGELIETFSEEGDLVVDPFAGSGTIPFEASIRGRRAFGADASSYARILTRAKLNAPASLEDAIELTEVALNEAERLPEPDLRSVPKWVRSFFHPATLREALTFAQVGRKQGNEFPMACFLGILHHQRPGFLSYPSSHLVPYLRDKKFPRSEYPELYEYRELRPRLVAKVRRSYRRLAAHETSDVIFIQSKIQDLDLPPKFDALITSPPYMNALDYGRDNRLRLWFIDPTLAGPADTDATGRKEAFVEAITHVATKTENGLKSKGYCVFIVGEEFKRSFAAHPSETVVAIVATHAPSLRLRKILADQIPDVRRTRHECCGVKTEHFLIFQRQ